MTGNAGSATYIEASDGTVWFWSEGLGIWTGWQPGEDGVWTYTAEEMARYYPEVVDPR